MPNKTKIIEQLIRIYSNSKIDRISDNETYIKLSQEYRSQLWFTTLRLQIEKARKKLHRNVDIQKTSKSEITECLKLLHRARRYDRDKSNFEYYLKLINNIYSQHWSKEQVEYFNNIVNTIENNKSDYFLSFTTRRVQENDINNIHIDHYGFIKDSLSYKNSTIQEFDQKNHNLLARAINYLLSTKQLEGFYHPNRAGDNAYVDEKLKTECQSALVFVQLVQNIMFTPPKNGRNNYCYEEYKHSVDMVIQPRFYVLGEECNENLLAKSLFSDDYDDWHDEITQQDKVHLEFTLKGDYGLEDIKKQKKKITNDLYNSIEAAKNELFENVPV